MHHLARAGAIVAVLLSAGCTQRTQLAITDRLKPCTGDDTPVDAVCGTLKVFENRATKQGRQIDLNIVVLPALRGDAAPDPLFFLAGGPGQGATKMATMVREMFRQVLTDRDIVLVDQRGTGKSNPLNCKDEDDSLAAFGRTDADSAAMLKKCLAGYDADLRLYTTPIAMDDLDEVRAFLGYDRTNIYGGSYGTRAVREIIRRLKDEGHTVLFSSHVMQEVSALCDTIIVIARGKIVAAGSPDDLRQQTGQPNLADAFVVLSGLDPDVPTDARSAQVGPGAAS